VDTVVVAGASLAGLRAAETLRADGYDRRIIVIGAEPHLPYDRPPLSKEVLQGRAEPASTMLRSEEKIAALEAEFLLGRRAVGLDMSERHVALDGGEQVAFDGLVVATGAAPRPLPGAPVLAGVHVLRTLDDCIALRQDMEAGARVVVVGAGFIGSEVAATARARGLDATVLEALPVPLERALGPEMGAAVSLLHRDHGVDLRLSATVAAIEGGERVERVRLGDGSALAADAVVVGIGVTPCAGWLEGSGLDVADGVVCDERCVAGPGVVAAGDVARWRNALFDEVMRVEHWDNANMQGKAAARSLLHGDAAEPYAPVPYFWSDQYDTKIQFVGRAAPYDEVRVVMGSVDERRFVALYRRGPSVTGALALSMPRQLMRFRALIAERSSWAAAVAAAET
jgi:NADPH-dependent 2,4-dienoyl-CoA reductase/sulfur reductase-like enzyme